MAIKIIKKGRLPSEREFRITCSSCKTVLDFVATDGIYQDSQRGGESWKIKCPLCTKPIYATASDQKTS